MNKYFVFLVVLAFGALFSFISVKIIDPDPSISIALFIYIPFVFVLNICLSIFALKLLKTKEFGHSFLINAFINPIIYHIIFVSGISSHVEREWTKWEYGDLDSMNTVSIADNGINWYKGYSTNPSSSWTIETGQYSWKGDTLFLNENEMMKYVIINDILYDSSQIKVSNLDVLIK